MWLIILVSVLTTSILSGIIGMGGGVILMGVLVYLLPISQAMILHGITQMFANGSRSYFHWSHIKWRVLNTYLLGSLLTLSVFFFVAIQVEKSIFYILLGLLSITGFFIPKHLHLNILNRKTAFWCGAAVTGSQLLVGVSGSILDLFYLKSNLNRFEIVATKAVTQTIGHFIKIIFYGYIFYMESAEVSLPIWNYIVVIPVAVVGTKLGSNILHRIDDHLFLKFSKILMSLLGVIYLYRGFHLL